MSDAAGFAGGAGFSSAGAGAAHHPRARLSEPERLKSNSIELKVWAVLFTLIMLATITLIVVVLMEAPPRAHAALLFRVSIAALPF